jgi:CubicO group peptidase (beta-lactamase class C family)
MVTTRAILGVLILLTANARFGLAASEKPMHSLTDLATNVDRYLAPYIDRRDFSGVVLFARDGNVLYHKAYGLADCKAGVLNTVRTRFRIASLTKTFTAAAIVILAERKRLGLNDPLSKFLPGYPDGDKIRIHHLLSHAAGVPDPEPADFFDKPMTPDELIGTFKNKPLEFEPGTRGKYSNGGYVLLARVIEKASGRPYADFLNDNIFKPVGMADTGVTDLGQPPDVQAKGYAPAPGPLGLSPAPARHPSTLFGSGILSSTAGDLRLWAAAVRSERLFKRSALPYTFGWGERKKYGHRYLEQSGRIPGFMSHLIVLLDEPVDIVCLCNVDTGLFGRLEKDLIALAYGGQPDKPPAAPVAVAGDAKRLLDCAGRYQGPGFVLRLVEDGGQVYSKFDDGPARAWLTPLADGDFYMRAEYAPVRIIRDTKGRASELSIAWGGTDPPMKLTRIPSRP